LLVAENGTINPDRVSDIVGANGYRDKGLCQINIGYHSHIVFDERFSDWKWQIEKCYELYENGTIFYGLKKYHNNNNFKKTIDNLLTYNYEFTTNKK